MSPMNSPATAPSSSNPPSGAGSGGSGSPTSASRFIYGTPGFESGNLQAGQINSGTGAVSLIAGSPFNEGLGQSSIIQVIGDPKGRFVYALNVEASAVGTVIGNPGIGGFAINQQSGALTRIPGSHNQFPVRNNNLLTMDGAGHFLFEPDGVNGSPSTGFNIYGIDQSTGALTKSSATSNAPPVGSFSLASPDGRLLFNSGNGLVEAFSINSANGQLTSSGSPISTQGSAGPMALSSDGKFLYVANQKEGNVAVFAIGASGNLVPVTGSPFAIDSGAQYLALTPDGKFLYVAASTSLGQAVKGYAVNPSAATFTPIPGAAVNNVTSVNLDQSGKFAYISDAGDLFTYSIDSATGVLKQISRTSGPSSDDAWDMVTTP